MRDINQNADLVERLRDGIVVAPSLTGGGSHIDIAATEAMLSKAAAEISRLRDALTAALPAIDGYVDRCDFTKGNAIREIARTALEANHGRS